MTSLDSIVSIINGYLYAKDTDRVFTYIEFIKMFGYENDTNTFITVYKDYVTRWAAIKKQSINISDDDFVMTKMVDILKSITLDYSSYEQQDFIAHIDLSNKSHIKALSALFSRKIRQITEFYRKKRNESVTVIRKNSMKGSKKSIEQIVYEKIFDFVFSNRNIFPSYKNIKRDLMVSVENYVDTYSQYFDIPRQKEFTDKSRAEMLSANMNDVDYRVYLEIELVISQILFSGNVYLQEIPLVAQVGVDLSQSCVGDMLALKNNLMANTQVNQVDLNEQVALKRKLYEKFLGCDLWYMYVDLQGNITMDILCKAKNPTGNLLNCGTADTATIQSSELKLLSQIGLFFKPEKTSILKVNAKDYTWTVDTDVIQNDTMYVFPDPNRYGDIGNNKSPYYPLLMQYKFNYDIRNLSSGEAANDPIKMITDQGWYSYYSKQDDDFKTIDNKNYEYIFTWLCNKGYISNYQQDIWGNHFGILKGCEIKYKYDQNGKKVGVDTIILQENHNGSELKDVDTGQEIESQALLLNGGYFEDPFHKGEIKTVYEINPEKDIQKYGQKDATVFYKDKAELLPFRVNKTSRSLSSNENISESIFVRDFTNNKNNKLLQRSVRRQITVDELKLAGDDWKKYYVAYKKPVQRWVFKSPQYEIGRQDKVVPFPFQKKMKLTDTYRWSGISIKNEKFFYPDTNNFINYGTFERNIRYNNETAYVDNFGKTNLSYQTDKSFDEIITDVLLSFATQDVYTNKEVNVERINTPFQQMQKKSGQFYIKTVGNLYDKPKKVQDVFDWVNWETKGEPYSFSLVKNTLIVQSDKCISFIPYTYDGYNIISTLGLKQQFVINKPANTDTQLLFVEHKNLIYVLQTSIVKGSKKMWVKPIIYSFNPSEYTMKQVLNTYDVVYKELFQSKKLDKERQFSSFVTLKDNYVKNYDNYAAYKAFIEGSETYANEYEKFRDFQIPYSNVLNPVQDVVFSYNSSLGLFLISYCYIDSNSTPYIFEHKFKLDTMQYFCGSLVSSVYTIKKVVDVNDNIIDVNYRYNDKLTSPQKMVTFPQTSNVSSIFTLAKSGSYINGKPPVYVQPQDDDEDEENWQIDWVTPPNSQGGSQPGGSGSFNPDNGSGSGGNTSGGNNTGSGSGGNSGNTGGSTGGEDGDSTGGDTGGDNTGGNTGGGDGDNSGDNTGSGSGGSAGDNTGGGSGDIKPDDIIQPMSAYYGSGYLYTFGSNETNADTLISTHELTISGERQRTQNGTLTLSIDGNQIKNNIVMMPTNTSNDKWSIKTINVFALVQESSEMYNVMFTISSDGQAGDIGLKLNISCDNYIEGVKFLYNQTPIIFEDIEPPTIDPEQAEHYTYNYQKTFDELDSIGFVNEDEQIEYTYDYQETFDELDSIGFVADGEQITYTYDMTYNLENINHQFEAKN